MRRSQLHSLLESAYAKHHSQFARSRDPLSLVHGYSNPKDQEITGLICALLAYGNVATILSSSKKVLQALGPTPHKTLTQRPHIPLEGFRHRFTTGEDIEVLLSWLHRALKTHGSLEAFFMDGQVATSPMRHLLSDFVRRFTTQPLPSGLEIKRKRRERQLKYLISDPERGSACKRLNMYLRWMIRPNDGIDLGLWKSLAASSLILPLDTHLLQTLRALRWTKSQQASWKMAEEATARLKELCPEDPIRYDFSLCHLSMEGGKILHYKAR